jgi:hypothetical protein
MKLWVGQGSEHSYNLVLVGRFTDETASRTVEEKYERLTKAASDGLPDTGWDEVEARFSDELVDLLKELKPWNMSRSDINGFAYHDAMSRNGATVTVTTEDAEVQGLIKLLIDQGAKVEIYSRHDWTETGEPRKPENN